MHTETDSRDSTAAVAPVKASGKSRGKVITTLAALLLAAGLLFWSLRGIEWKEVFSIIAHARPLPLAFCCLLASGALFLRAFRWRILLTAEAPIGVAIAFWATAAGYFGNNFLPARAGELVRTFMISSRSPLRKAYVLTTAFAERVADAIALVVITGLVLLFLPNQPLWLAGAARGFAAIGLVGVLSIALLPRMEALAKRLLHHLPGSSGLKFKLTHMLEHSLRGLRAFHDGKRLIGFIGLTVVIWCMDATSTVIGSRALGLDITFPVAFLLIAALGLGSALPSAPGYVGIYQAVAVTVLVPFGFTRTAAIAYILLAQALSYLVIGIWGAIGFLQYKRMEVEAAPEMQVHEAAV